MLSKSTKNKKTVLSFAVDDYTKTLLDYLILVKGTNRSIIIRDAISYYRMNVANKREGEQAQG